MREGLDVAGVTAAAEGCPSAGVMRVAPGAEMGGRPAADGCDWDAAEPVFRPRAESAANSRNCQKGRGPPPGAATKSISVMEPSRMRAEISCAVSPCSMVPSERWRLKIGLGGDSDKVGRWALGIVRMGRLLVGTGGES